MKKITEFIDEKVFQCSIEGFEISLLPDMSYWIENQDGEGTQVSRDLLNEKMNDLFDELM